MVRASGCTNALTICLFRKLDSPIFYELLNFPPRTFFSAYISKSQFLLLAVQNPN